MPLPLSLTSASAFLPSLTVAVVVEITLPSLSRLLIVIVDSPLVSSRSTLPSVDLPSLPSLTVAVVVEITLPSLSRFLIVIVDSPLLLSRSTLPSVDLPSLPAAPVAPSFTIVEVV